MKVEIDKKLALTIEEAAAYSNIGVNTLRSLIKRPELESAVLQVGRKCLIKRKQLEEFINKENSIDIRRE